MPTMPEDKAATPVVALTVDAKGLACPMPVFRAKKGLMSVNVGEVVEVWATDPGSMPDFKAFANSTGHELLAAEQQGDVYRFLLRRAK
jgi:tRNA 2-thiouridine synthesizing protein A